GTVHPGQGGAHGRASGLRIAPVARATTEPVVVPSESQILAAGLRLRRDRLRYRADRVSVRATLRLVAAAPDDDEGDGRDQQEAIRFNGSYSAGEAWGRACPAHLAREAPSLSKDVICACPAGSVGPNPIDHRPTIFFVQRSAQPVPRHARAVEGREGRCAAA